MKKVILSLAVIFSVAMVSCGGKKAAEAADSAAEVVTEEVVAEGIDSLTAGPDSGALDTTVEVAAAVVDAQ